MNLTKKLTIDLTLISGIFITFVHFFLALTFADKFPIVWCELPLLAIVIALSFARLIRPALPLCFATVCLFLMAEPATGFSYITWFLILPYFFLLEQENRLWVLALLGTWTGVLIASGIFPWMWRAMITFFEINPVIAFFLFLIFVFLIGVQHTLFLPLARFLSDRLRLPIILIAPGLYTVIEYWMPLPMPIALSAGFINTPFFLQPADLLGMHGVSFLIVVVTSALFFAFKSLRERNKRDFFTALSIALIIFSFHIVYGIWSFSRYRDDPNSSSVDIAMIQPVAPLKVKNTDYHTQEQVAGELKRLSLEAIRSKKNPPDLLIWPEGAGPFASRTPEFNPAYMRAVVDIQKATSTSLLVQDVEFTKIPGTGKVRYYSTVSLIEPVGRTVESYRKNILMPFSEYLPMERTFPFLRKWFRESRSILPGEMANPLDAPGGPIAPLICYEVLFPDYVRHFVRKGCCYIVNLTNDRWYGVRQQPHQHLGIAVLRAIENRRPIARATNSGISAFIDACGVIPPGLQTTPMKKTILRGQVYPRTDYTFFTRYGDILHRWLFTPLYLALCLYAFILRGRSTRKGIRESSTSKISGRRKKQR